jgi:O-acetyl-ADP-ribose deacetylase (regulator of RNase III)
MMIQEVECNIFEAGADIISQCNNCFCTQGSGIARAIRDRYPEVYDADCQTKKGDKSKLGTIFMTAVTPFDENDTIKYVAGIFGQFEYGRETRHLNYEATFRGFEALREYIRDAPGFLPNYTLAFPYKIGCKLAGGSWPVVKAMIYDVFNDFTLKTLICRKPGDE